MSNTTFILASSSTPSNLPKAPQLHILPFSLGPNSNAYSTKSAPTSLYFQPRPAPPNFPSIPAGTPISTFRGRTLVGHTLDVPKGYRGVILGTSKRPDQGGLEYRNTNDKGKGKGKVIEKWPLTPASSVGSVASVSGDTGGKRVTRQNTRGQGQIALSRPKARQPPKKPVVKKRYRLDSDDDDDDDDADEGVKVEVEVVKQETPIRTPSKRFRKAEIISPVKDPRLPAIIVQAPTPLKAPPVTMKERFLDEDVDVQDGEKPGVVELAGGPLKDEEEVKSGSEKVDNALELDLVVEDVKEEIVPSPSTEEDPPNFTIEDKASPHLVSGTDIVVEEEATEAYGSIRTLRPISTFDNITLWTPDGPLPGFRADEKEGEAGVEEGDGEDKLRKGWWRTGGAGEGGDDIVRVMGEWLGLVEILNKPVYLDGLDEEEDDDEDD